MSDQADDAKTAKKAAKAQAKVEKKLAKVRDSPTAEGGERTSASVQGRRDHLGPTPAERSAAAAERQVALQGYRVIFAAVVAVVAILTLIATVKPWKSTDARSDPSPNNAVESP